MTTHSSDEFDSEDEQEKEDCIEDMEHLSEGSISEIDEDVGAESAAHKPPTHKLTLGSIAEDLKLLTDKRHVPTTLYKNKENVEPLLKGIVDYCQQVPSIYWKALVEDQNNLKNATVDPELFPAGFKFIGKSKSGVTDVGMDQINWYKIINLARKKGYKSISGNGNKVETKDDVKSMKNYFDKASIEKQSGDFARILCSLFVKLFDAKLKTPRPSKALRDQHLGTSNYFLTGYKAHLANQESSPEGSSKWKRRICLPAGFHSTFPSSVSEEDSPLLQNEEIETDDENEEIPLSQPATSQKLGSFRPHQRLVVGTRDLLEQAEKDLEGEKDRQANYELLLIQSKTNVISIQKRIDELQRQLRKEETDGVVVSGICSNLSHEEYLVNGPRIAPAFLTIYQSYLKTGGSMTWERFMEAVQAKISDIQPEGIGFEQVVESLNEAESTNTHKNDEIEISSQEKPEALTNTICSKTAGTENIGKVHGGSEPHVDSFLCVLDPASSSKIIQDLNSKKPKKVTSQKEKQFGPSPGIMQLMNAVQRGKRPATSKTQEASGSKLLKKTTRREEGDVPAKSDSEGAEILEVEREETVETVNLEPESEVAELEKINEMAFSSARVD